MNNNEIHVKKRIMTIFIICISLSLPIISCSTPLPDKPVTPVSQGVVMFINGKADITHIDGTTNELKQSDVLRKGDSLKTSLMSYVIIQFGNDIIMRIQEDTSIEIKRLLENAQTELSLKNGQIISHVRKLTKEDNFVIETPTAVAAVRGTQYSISYYPSRSVLAVKDGKVQLIMKNEKLKEKEHLVETAFTYIMSSQSSRSINEFETLEIDKLSQVPFATKDDLDNKKAFTAVEQISVKDDERISSEIKAKGGPLPKSREDIIKQKGFLNIVILYSNRTYTGEILSRGKEITIRTVDGIVTVPFKQVRNIKRTQ
jgi:hypothetical protein